MKHKTVFSLLLFCYLAVLFQYTVFRPGFGSYPLFSHGSFNTELFTDLLRIRRNSEARFLYLFLGNIFTFLPFGFLVLPLVGGKQTGRAFLLTVISGFFLSLTIELAQWAFGVGVSELDDLILNTFGVFLGALCCLPFRKAVIQK